MNVLMGYDPRAFRKHHARKCDGAATGDDVGVSLGGNHRDIGDQRRIYRNEIGGPDTSEKIDDRRVADDFRHIDHEGKNIEYHPRADDLNEEQGREIHQNDEYTAENPPDAGLERHASTHVKGETEADHDQASGRSYNGPLQVFVEIFIPVEGCQTFLDGSIGFQSLSRLPILSIDTYPSANVGPPAFTSAGYKQFHLFIQPIGPNEYVKFSGLSIIKTPPALIYQHIVIINYFKFHPVPLQPLNPVLCFRGTLIDNGFQ
jgi:hypothetical protein